MPVKYRRRKPIKDRVYRSSPVMAQSKLSRLRKATRAVTSTPSTLGRQATLTQMEFPTPQRFPLDNEIADGDKDENFAAERPKKKVKREGKMSSKPDSSKQNTLTQMDWAMVLGHSIPDSQDEDEEEGNWQEVFEGVDGEERVPSAQRGVVRFQRRATNDEEIEEAAEQPHRSRLEEVEEFEEHKEQEQPTGLQFDSSPPRELGQQCVDPISSTHSVPKTPKRVRTEPVPSSQSPPVTPISIPGTRVQRPIPAPVSPTPFRMAPPALPIVRTSPLKELPSSSPTLTQTQTQTQMTPNTKRKIEDFNRGFLMKGPPPRPPNPMVGQNTYGIGEETQAMFLQIPMDDIGVETEPARDRLLSNPLETGGVDGLVSVPRSSNFILIQSSQDDEIIPDSPPYEAHGIEEAVVTASKGYATGNIGHNLTDALHPVVFS
jgi:hypothetical protein